jgi:hypothetical protein
MIRYAVPPQPEPDKPEPQQPAPSPRSLPRARKRTSPMTDYAYNMKLVVDPDNPRNVVAAGSISIYDSADLGRTTLLELKDPSGVPIPNPITSNANGFTPPFVTTSPQVLWASGPYTDFFESYKGMRDEAVAAVSAAETAAANAGAEAAAVATAAIGTATSGQQRRPPLHRLPRLPQPPARPQQPTPPHLSEPPQTPPSLPPSTTPHRPRKRHFLPRFLTRSRRIPFRSGRPRRRILRAIKYSARLGKSSRPKLVSRQAPVTTQPTGTGLYSTASRTFSPA